MVEVVTYHSINAKPNEAWLAYVVLPNGDHWMVRFASSSEETAKAKAISLYEAERTKVAQVLNNSPRNDDDEKEVNIVDHKDGRGHHFAGKAWLIHKVTRIKIRVPVAEVSQYLNEYDRGGPRSK